MSLRPNLVARGTELAGLLDLMREPADHLTRVDEVVEITPQGAASRRLSLTIATPARHGVRLLDVKHPLKGTLEMVDVAGTCAIEPLTHHDHVRVSRDLVAYRYLSLLQTASLPTTSGLSELARDLTSLTRLPLESADTALATFRTVFYRDREHWRLFSFDSLAIQSYDQAMLDSLARLCKRLCRRYLQLVRIHGGTRTAEDITLQYVEEFTSDPVVGIKRSQLIQRSRRAAKEWLNAPSPTWRFHIPWAKRTSHYSFSVSAPQDRFLALQGLTVGDAEGQGSRNVLAEPPGRVSGNTWAGVAFGDEDPKWSIQTRKGRASSIFVGDAHNYRQRLFCVFRALELPGHSLLRMALATSFILVVLCLLAIWKSFRVGDLPQVSALIPAVLAVGALALQPQGHPGVLGYPASSRITPVILAICCVVFTFWLTANGEAAAPDQIDHAGMGAATEDLWSYWKRYGWFPVLAFLTGFCWRSLWIYRAVVHAHRDRLGEKTIISSNFYQ